MQTSKIHHPKVSLQPAFVPLFPADSVETVNEVEPPTAALPIGSTRRKPSTDELLSAVEPVLCEALVSQVGASYQVDILLPSGARSTYFIDLSSGHCSLGLLYFAPVYSLHALHPTKLGGKGFQTKPLW